LWDGINTSGAPTMPNVIGDRRHFDGAGCAFADGHVKWVKRHPALWNTAKGVDYWDAPVDAE